MIYAKKTALGSYKVVPWDDPEKTHILMPFQTYMQEKKQHTQQLQKAKEFAINQINKYKNSIEHEKNALVNSYKAEILQKQKCIDDCNKIIDETKKLLIETEKNRDKHILLNQNLLRITRERANSDRGLTQKKHHTGYIILSCEEWTDKFNVESDYAVWRQKHPFSPKEDFISQEVITLNSWRSLIQTPYNATIPITQVKECTLTDLNKSSVKEHLGYDEVFVESLPHINNNKNSLYKYRFKANHKLGYWEMYVFTTLPLTPRDVYQNF